MTNGDAGRTVWNDLLRAITLEYGWPSSLDYGGHGFFYPERHLPPLPAENHAPYLGRYELGRAAAIVISSGAEGELVAEIQGQPPIPLRPDETGAFWAPPFLNLSASFDWNADRVVGLRLRLEEGEKRFLRAV